MLVVVSALVATFDAFSHGGKHGDAEIHSSHEKKAVNAKRLEQINQEYILSVRPIFAKRCFDCHAGNTQYPWYYKIPGAKQLIDSDIKEAKKHLDMSNDFPFGGHGDPKEDLSVVRESIEKNTMPPFRYQIMHLGSRITEEEEKVIFEWLEKSEKVLNDTQ